MRERKLAAFAALEDSYAGLRASWNGYHGYDAWFDLELNNARLVPVATYHRLVPAFRALMRDSGDDLARFYASCEGLADMPIEQRTEELEALLAISSTDEFESVGF